MTVNKSVKEDNLTTMTEKVNTKVKAPKNVRQIGKIGDGLKIYVEDYVKTYTKQLAESDYTSRSIAVLVGEYRHMESERNVFLYGAIKVETEDGQECNIFTEETWTSIYEKIKEYFPDAEIVGWYYGGTGFGPEDLAVLEQIHSNNFAGRDKVLLTYDALEKENNIYLYDGISMVVQSGFYIYYEKNLEMQSYMVDHKKVKREEQDVDDHATVKMRTILNEKKPSEKKEKEQKMMLRLGYAAAGMVLAVTLIVSYTLIGNSERMKDLEGDVQTMKNIFEKDPTENNPIEKDSIEKVAIGKELIEKEPAANVPIEGEEDKQTEDSESLGRLDEQGDEELVITPTPVPTDKPIEMTPTPVAVQPTEALPTATIEPTEQPIMSIKPEELEEYIIKSGDTLASICLRKCGDYNMLSAVKELNGIQNEDVIYIGQVILIPKK